MEHTFQFIIANFWDIFKALIPIFTGLIAFLTAIIGIFVLIPGDQPEKFLQGVVDFLQKIVNFLKSVSLK